LWRVSLMSRSLSSEEILQSSLPPQTRLSSLHESLGVTPRSKILSDWNDKLAVVLTVDKEQHYQMLALAKDGNKMVWLERCTLQVGEAATHLECRSGWHYTGQLFFEEAWEEAARLAPNAKVTGRDDTTVSNTPKERRPDGWDNERGVITQRSQDGTSIKAIFLEDGQFYHMEWRP